MQGRSCRGTQPRRTSARSHRQDQLEAGQLRRVVIAERGWRRAEARNRRGASYAVPPLYSGAISIKNLAVQTWSDVVVHVAVRLSGEEVDHEQAEGRGAHERYDRSHPLLRELVRVHVDAADSASFDMLLTRVPGIGEELTSRADAHPRHESAAKPALSLGEMLGGS